MALGTMLKEARERKGLTREQAANETRLMFSVIEGLENEDFRKIAAPIYGRGFLKLYAELLEIDPAPLLADYAALQAGAAIKNAVRTDPRGERAAPAKPTETPRPERPVPVPAAAGTPATTETATPPFARVIAQAKAARQEAAKAAAEDRMPVALPEPESSREIPVVRTEMPRPAASASDDPSTEIPTEEAGEPDLFNPNRRPATEPTTQPERVQPARHTLFSRDRSQPVFARSEPTATPSSRSTTRATAMTAVLKARLTQLGRSACKAAETLLANPQRLRQAGLVLGAVIFLGLFAYAVRFVMNAAQKPTDTVEVAAETADSPITVSRCIPLREPYID